MTAFFPDIGGIIDAKFAEIWAKLLYYVTFSFLDPFWGWAAMLAALYIVVLLLCWFFGTFWPVLRVIGGALLLGATFGLYAYAQGAREAREHDSKKPGKKR